MRIYDVKIEIKGKPIKVGTLEGNGGNDAVFTYSEEYLASADPAPISVSLPLTPEPFSPEATRCFFESLLPEGFTRRSVAQWMHLGEADYLLLLHALGCECLGAVQISEEKESHVPGYTLLTEEELRTLAVRGAAHPMEMMTKSHLSLAGASAKTGLYYDTESGKWFLPKGTAPSTHIVKQSHVRLDRIVANEQLSLLTARRCGIEVPESFILNLGSTDEDEVLFATRRYDRDFQEICRTIDGLPAPLRLHQEDFAQALGIPSSEKYESAARNHFRSMAELIRRTCRNPISDLSRLWDMVVFDFLIGNTDAHIKNFSLLYSPDLKSCRLAPAYDLVSTVVYETSTHDMAFHIGGVRSIDKLTVDSFREAAKEIGLGQRMAMRRFSDMCDRFPSALAASEEELLASGYKEARPLADKIREKGGVRSFL